MVELGRLPVFLHVTGTAIAFHALMEGGLRWGVAACTIGLCRLADQGVGEMGPIANWHDPALMLYMAREAVLRFKALVKG